MPKPKHTLHTVWRWFSPAADNTIRNTETANGPPNYPHFEYVIDNTGIPNTHTEDEVCNHYKYCDMRLLAMLQYYVGRTRIIRPGPRLLIIFSLAASDALVEDAGYSPPTPLLWSARGALNSKKRAYNPCKSSASQLAWNGTNSVETHLANVKNQKSPAGLPSAPWAAVASVAPTTIRAVVITSAAFLPILSHMTPTTICPRIAPEKKSKEWPYECLRKYLASYRQAESLIPWWRRL
jgi:hypothetical protein